MQPRTPAPPRRRGVAAALAGCFLLLAACSASSPPAGRGGAHGPHVVSLNPCSDAVLAQITRPGQLLAISHYSRDPASSSMDPALARRFRATGGTVEEIVALHPDVVVAGGFLDPARAQALRDLGIALVTLPMPQDIAASEAQVRELARVTGNPARGEALIARIERAMAQYAPRPGSRPVPALVWESGGIVAGDATLIADLLAHAGFANAAAARGLSQADYLPLEEVVADPPRMLFTVGDRVSESDRLLRHPALEALAGMDRAALPGSLLWCGGPTIPRALARLGAVRRSLEAARGTRLADGAEGR